MSDYIVDFKKKGDDKVVFRFELRRVSAGLILGVNSNKPNWNELENRSWKVNISNATTKEIQVVITKDAGEAYPAFEFTFQGKTKKYTSKVKVSDLKDIEFDTTQVTNNVNKTKKNKNNNNKNNNKNNNNNNEDPDNVEENNNSAKSVSSDPWMTRGKNVVSKSLTMTRNQYRLQEEVAKAAKERQKKKINTLFESITITIAALNKSSDDTLEYINKLIIKKSSHISGVWRILSSNLTPDEFDQLKNKIEAEKSKTEVLERLEDELSSIFKSGLTINVNNTGRMNTLQRKLDSIKNKQREITARIRELQLTTTQSVLFKALEKGAEVSNLFTGFMRRWGITRKNRRS